MDKWQRRTAYYLLMLTGVMLVYAVIYDYGMSAYESEPETFLHSLQVVVETFTTTGFGSDAPWHTPEMNLLVIIMDTTGVFLIFLALPVLVFPAMEELLSTTVPTSVSESLTDHVLVCTYTARADALIDELDAWGVDSVILEPDRDTAVQLHEAGYDVINADPESTEGLEDAGIVRARALVADVSDEVDASIVLAAGEVGDEDLQVVSVVEDPESASYHRLAGADEVLSPRPLLGRGLASKVTTGISTELGDAIEIGDDFDIAELPIHRTSELVGKTLSDSGSGSASDIAMAVRYAVDNGADVLVMSLGSAVFNEALADAISYAHDEGVPCVVAAGNSRHTVRWIASPADADKAVTVTAATAEPADEAMSAAFSQVDPDPGTTDLSGGETAGSHVDVVAPGCKITVQTPSGLSQLTGTSMAAPVVAGGIMQLYAADSGPKGDVEATKERLAYAAPAPKIGETEAAHGMLDVAAAIDEVEPDETQSEARTDTAAARDAAHRQLSDMQGGTLARFLSR